MRKHKFDISDTGVDMIILSKFNRSMNVIMEAEKTAEQNRKSVTTTNVNQKEGDCYKSEGIFKTGSAIE